MCQNSQILISNLIDTFILNRGKYISKKDIFVQYMQILDLGVQICNLDQTHSNASFDKMKDIRCNMYNTFRNWIFSALIANSN